MKRVFSFVAALFVAAVMIVSCASKAEKVANEMMEAVNANNKAKVETLIKDLGNIEDNKQTGETKVALACGYIYLALANKDTDMDKFVECRNLVMGVVEASKDDPEFVKVCNELKKETSFDLMAQAEAIKGVMLEEAIDEALEGEYEEEEDEE